MGSPGRIILTSFGWNDSGGGTLVPRLVAKELARRGWDVTVFHAAVGRTDSPHAYDVREWSEDGVRLIGVHNRPHGLLDLGNPLREIDDPPISSAFAAALDRLRPDVVHFHNLHNLGAGLVDQAAARGIRSLFTTHNYWLVCPRNYLLTGDMSLCAGPSERGGGCAACVGSGDRVGHERRLAEIRGRFARGVDVCLAVSDAVRRTLVAAGYPDEMIDVVPQALPAAEAVWDALGATRAPGRAGEELTVGFFGSAYPLKGPHLLVEAAQRTERPVRVRIHGEIPDAFAARLRALDVRGCVEIHGRFGPEDLPSLLAGVDAVALPSLSWDCAPLMASEVLAGRVPLLAARMGGLPEAVEHERTGLLFDGRDASDLARAMDRLAGEEGLLERLQSAITPPRRFADHVDELETYYAGERPRRGERRAAPPLVRWIGDHAAPTSLSIVNQRVVERLRDAGVPVSRVERNGTTADAAPAHVADVEVRHQWPPDLSPAPAGRLAVIQPWEFGAIPRDWLDPIARNVDELWVPSELVRDMYVGTGVDAERVHVVPNGVDLDRFRPDGPRLADVPGDGVRFLFVGGLTGRKGPDVLLNAYMEAFAGRDDVTLVVKDFGADGIYAGFDRDGLRAHAATGALPRVVYLDRTLSEDEMAALYRSCDVLVHPYRGEGFGMPVLEAMASGIPTIVTAGGPTDEFCPDEACWRIASARRPLPGGRVDSLVTAGTPWLLEPDRAHLVSLLREAAADAGARRARGGAARRAAERLPWSAVADAYRARIEALAARPVRHAAAPAEPFPFEEPAAVRVLATPAWRGADRLGELLAAWAAAYPAGADAALVLLADPAVHGPVEELATRVMAAAAAADVDLERAGDITLLAQSFAAADVERLHASVDAYVPLHAACEGHARLARAAGAAVLPPAAAGLAALRPARAA